MMSRPLRVLLTAPRYPFVWLLKLYRLAISPLYGNVCRYYPSCSAYALDAFEVHGVFQGFWLTARRLLRCNPWSAGGVDYVRGSEAERRSQLIAAGLTEPTGPVRSSTGAGAPSIVTEPHATDCDHTKDAAQRVFPARMATASRIRSN